MAEMMKALLVLVIASAAVVCVSSLPLSTHFKQFSEEQVINCLFDEDSVIQQFMSVVEEKQFDIWSLRSNGATVRGKKHELSSSFQNFDCSILIQDLGIFLEEDDKRLENNRKKRDVPFFEKYHTYEEIVEYMEELQNKYPKFVTFVPSIGKTYEERDIPVLRIKGTENPAKTIWFSAGIHAREWIAPATVLYLATKLIEGAGNDKTVNTLLNSIEYVIAPMCNPDGYSFSWKYNRMWRKNRRLAPPERPTCHGVDLNRNFDNHWGGVGASSYPCAEDYRGPSVASEPETVAIQNYVLSLPNRSGAIDFHSYGQLILRSFGYTKQYSPNEEILGKVGYHMKEIIRQKSGIMYESIRASDFYPTTGSTDDWYTEQAGMWGWTIELRDSGVFGFRLPEDQIIATGEETWEAMVFFSEQIISMGPISN